MGNMRNTRNLSLFNNLNNMSSDEVFEIGANCLLVLKTAFLQS